MAVVPSELITGRWNLTSSVCTLMCFGHIDSAVACFNEGCSIFPTAASHSFLLAKKPRV